MQNADELLLDDDFLDASCLAREECVQKLMQDAPAGCLYCALGSLEGDED